jgi:exosortase E/protease (VPEID-CTERM system)
LFTTTLHVVAGNPPAATAAHQAGNGAMPASAYVAPLALLILLVVEVFGLTLTFDTQSLLNIPSGWARIVDWSPQYLRLAIAVIGATLLLGGRSLMTWLADAASAAAEHPRSMPAAVHGAAFLMFAWITRVVIGGDLASAQTPAFLALAWLAAGAATAISWAATVFPAGIWITGLRTYRGTIAVGAIIGSVGWTIGFATEALWTPLADYTFVVVRWGIERLYPVATVTAAEFVVGTPTFSVRISPACSGYEGIGLVLAFAVGYLWVVRDRLRLPAALALVPIGVVAVWLLNAARIVALIAIGTAGWPEIAMGGFHAQAGSLLFASVALGLVALSGRPVFSVRTVTDASPRFAAAAVPSAHGRHVDQTTGYLAPFLVVILTALVTGLFADDIDWLYPIRVAAVVIALWTCRTAYRTSLWHWSWPSVGLGVLIFGVWVIFTRDAGPTPTWVRALESTPPVWAAAWFLLRVVGYVVTVPIAEELAFRGYLTRRVISEDIEGHEPGSFTWLSFIVSSLAFGLFHGSHWVAGTLAGMAFALALYRRRRIGDAVLAHAVTNGLLAVYAIATGHWSAMS